MYELVEKIFYGVSFIAVGGTVALIFFFVFAPSILGSRTTHEQLERLQRQAEQIKQELQQIGEKLGGRAEGPKKEP